MGQYTSYYLYEKYERRCTSSTEDSCSDWIPCYPNAYSIDGDGTMPISAKTEDDPECGGSGSIIRWVDNGHTCDGESLYQELLKQISYDSGSTWINTSETKKGELIEEKSIECGFRPSLPSWLEGVDYKIFGCSYDYQSMYYTPCCGGDETVNTPVDGINEGETQCGIMIRGGKPYPPSGGTTNIFFASYYTRYLYIGNCVTHIGDDFLYDRNGLFYYYPDLRDLIIPNSVVDIGENGLRRTSYYTIVNDYTLVLGNGIEHIGENGILGWKNIIIDAINPPVLDGDNPLSIETNIYVPISSVELYKTDAKWGLYANKIKGI